MIRPVVLLDVDGVLANFIHATLSTLSRHTKRAPYTHDSITTWEVFDSLPEQERPHQDAVYRRMKLPGACYDIPVYPDAVEGVARLCAVADVIVVTSPFKGSQTWTHEREEWLWNHFGISHDDVIHARRKGFIRGDFLIDDKPSHLRDWRAMNPRGRAIYWKNPQFAEDMPGYVVCTRSWDTVIDEVSRFAEGKSKR